MDNQERFFRKNEKGHYDSNSGSTFEGLSNLTQLSPETQSHLQHVYGNLTITTAFASLAVYLFSRGILMEPGIIATIMLFGCMFAAAFMPNTPSNSMTRHGALYAFGFAEGWLASPLVNYVLAVDSNTVLLTIVATVLIFASFTMSALYSPRRQYLYLGGILGTAMSIMMLSGFANAFIGSTAMLNAELYIGLFIFSFYVLYDTQVIIERAEGGTRDPVLHAITLFTDLAAIFIRLLVILSKDKNNNNNEDRRNNNRRKK